jgi:hypothetical protein
MAMKVTMQVAGDALTYKVHEQLTFDPENTFVELGDQPGKLAWWYSLLTLKEQEADDFKARMEARAAERELELRGDTEDLAKQYGKVTEGVIKAALASDEDLVEMREKYNEIRRDVGLLKAMTRGSESRSVLLATAASAQKAELQAKLRKLVGKAEKGGTGD